MLDDQKTIHFQEGFENFSSTSSEIISYKPSEEVKEHESLKKELSESRSQYTKIRDVLRRDDLQRQECIQEIQKILDQIEKDREKSILGTIDHQKIRASKSNIIDKILRVTCEKLEAQTASIFLISKDGVLERAGIYGRDINQEEIESKWLSGERYEVLNNSFTGKAARHRDNSPYGAIQYTEVFKGSNEEENLIFEQYHEKFGDLKSALAIPLSGRNKTYGVLRICNSTNSSTLGVFPIENCNFKLYLTTLSTSISSRLSYFRRDVQSSLLEHFSHLLIQSTYDTEEIYQKILDLLVQNPETAFKAAILRVKIRNGSLSVKATSLFEGVSLNRDDEDRKEDGRSLLSSVARCKQRLIVPDIQSLINTNNEVNKEDHPFKNDQWIKKNGFQCFACFPLMTKDETQGTLSLYTGYNYEFHPDSIRFLQGIVDQLAAFIFRLKLEKQKQDFQTNLLDSYPSISQENEEKFNALVTKWKNDSKTSLLMTQKCTDASYQRIIGMGQQIIPLLLKKISEPSGEDWFWALSAVTNENPVKSEHRGIIDKIIEDWIKWGRSQGYEC